MHINKTGGTSIEAALGELMMPLGPEKHMDVKEMIEVYGKERWEKYFTFTFVRNPWDRMVSIFFWRRRVGFLPKDLEFKKFVMDFNYWKWQFTNRISASLVSQPQLLWLNENFKIDFIGKFENLQGDFNTVCDNLNIKKIKLPHKFKTDHLHYSEYYDRETKNEVYKIWGEDVDSFKYKFENHYI